MIRVRYKDASARKAISGAGKQVRFGTALGITRTVKRGKATGEKRINKKIDRPTPFTKRGVAITTAKKTKLIGSVFVKNRQAEYLQLPERGGTRLPRKDYLVEPANIKLNKYGNIPRRSRKLRGANTFVATGQDAKTRHLKPGVYKRGKQGQRRGGRGYGTKGDNWRGKGKKRSTIEMLASLETKQDRDAFLGFEATVQGHMAAVIETEIMKAIQEAFGTAR